MGPSPQAPANIYATLDFDRDELSAVMRTAWDELIAFVTAREFQAVYKELASLPAHRRPAFVARVLLNRDELRSRGVEVPDGILIQTSAFGDRRPTLFVVKKYLPSRFHTAWENVNLTFDNFYSDDEVPRSPELAWRRPLPVALQNAALAAGIDLQTLSYGDIRSTDPPGD